VVAAPKETDEEDDDSDLDEWLDDPALDELREQRLGELQAAHERRQQDLARGHGEVRTIRQDDFLTECTGTSAYVAVHFYSDDFARCAILDHHLAILAPQHVECKFLRLDATKAPFFVDKLQIRTLPTLVIFCDGKAVDRLVGFDALLQFDAKKNVDEWPTRRLAAWLAQAGAISYTPSAEEMRQDLEGLAIGSSRSNTSGSIYRGTRVVDEDNM
jgi:thiol-disulfide isomerase/thioredoxin